jgi:hypothetical protein
MPEFRNLADLFGCLSVVVASPLAADEALSVVCLAAVQAIDGADAAAVTKGRKDRFRTVGATSDLALRVDEIQSGLMSGPCVDAVPEQTVYRSDDLRTDTRWPEFAKRAVAETGVLSMLSFRMFFEEGDLAARLNIYATTSHVFDDLAETTGLVLATHAALALSSALRLERIESLERALATNRNIGVAMGILMSRHGASKQQAFDLLRIASQHTHRKLADVAADVIDQGDLMYPAPLDQQPVKRAGGGA